MRPRTGPPKPARPPARPPGLDRWARHAERLAAWTEENLVNRLDVYGRYIAVEKRNGQTATTDKTGLTRDVLARHFRGKNTGDLIGLHSTARGEDGASRSRWLGVDIDRHDNGVDPEATRRAAMELHRRAKGLGFRPLLFDSNGRGGYHLVLIFDAPAPTADVFRFGKWLCRDWQALGLDREPETFPKQAAIPRGGYGNWLRLPGRHHTHPHITRVWGGSGWLEGDDAIKAIIETKGTTATAIPAAALTTDAPPKAAPPTQAGWEGQPSAWKRGSRLTPEQRAVLYLNGCQAAISGQRGHDQAFKVACSIGPGFDLPPETAFRLIWEHYNPRCEPEWSEPQLRHKIEDAYRNEKRPRGWLLRQDMPPVGTNGRPPVGNDGASSLPPANGRPRDVDEPDIPVNEAPDDPHRLARAVLSGFRHHDGPTLVWYREEFYTWDGSAYRSDPSLRGRIVAAVKDELDRQNRLAIQAHREQAAADALAPSPGRPARPPTVTKVTRRLVADVLQAVESMTGIDHDADAPFWIQGRPGDPAPSSIVPASNGLVDLDADGGPALRAHTPRFFTTHALPYPFDPAAGRPVAWTRFLGEVWGQDAESIRELQKWFGYALTPDIDQQKILLLIGPPGSGRSTIRSVMEAVVGRRNVGSTSAVALANPFGLEPLMGKTLAILGDARTGDKHDNAVMMDRLLRISGGDPVEVNRKGRAILHDVLLRARLVIVSNEVPNFRDASKAIVRRYLPLCTPRSFTDEGTANEGLKAELLGELPSLLNWAIDGRAMLEADGRFITPPSAEDLIDDARALASPVAEFMAEECDLGPGLDETVDDVFKRWKAWAEKNGHHPGHKHLFGRNLRAAANYKIRTTRPREGDSRFRVFRGIALKPDLPTPAF